MIDLIQEGELNVDLPTNPNLNLNDIDGLRDTFASSPNSAR